MKVSVVIPVYNVAKYIEHCFDTVASQTYSNKEIECIFVDDCGADNSIQLVHEKIISYSGKIEFRIVCHKNNKGLSAARNTGTKASTGEYIYYLDSDDEITPICLDALVKLARKYNGVDIVQGNTKTVPEPSTGGDWRNISRLDYPEYSTDKLWIKARFFESPRVPANAWNKLIRKGFLLKNNLFFKEGIIQEDELWMFFVAKKINDIAFSEEYCYVHYLHENSIQRSGSSNKRLKSALIIIKEMSNNVDVELSSLQKKHIYRYLNITIKKMSGDEDKEVFRKSYMSLVKELLSSSVKRFRFYETILNISLLIPNIRYARDLSKKLIRYI